MRKFIQIIATMSQMHQIRFPASVLPSVRLSVRPSVRFKLYLRDGRTDNLSVRPFHRWSLTLTVVVLFSIVAFKTLTFHKVV